MRLVMMGTGPFAVPTFRALLDSNHVVLGLMTRPTPPFRGRGPAPVNPMRELAEQRGISVSAPDSVNSPESIAQLEQWAADLFVVCDYGQILKRDTLARARLGGINLHGSLLPRYRGAAPINWALYNGDPETGVTVIHMTPLLDGGPIIAVHRTPIEPEETAVELERRLAQAGVAPVLESLELLARWDGATPLGAMQDPQLATRAPRLTKADGEVDWGRPARAIRDQVRAFKPWPGTYTQCPSTKGEPVRLILTSVSVVAPTASSQDDATDRLQPGQVVRSDGERLWMRTGDGVLSIEELQPAGKRVMRVGEFLHGHAVPVGTQLGQ